MQESFQIWRDHGVTISREVEEKEEACALENGNVELSAARA